MRFFNWFLAKFLLLVAKPNNWLIHRQMKRNAEMLAKWAAHSYEGFRAQHPNVSDREIFRMMLDQRFKFPSGAADRELILDRYGSSIYGLCYYMGLNLEYMKHMMVIRCVQYIQYVDTALQKRGFKRPSTEAKRGYFKTLQLPETAVDENWL